MIIIIQYILIVGTAILMYILLLRGCAYRVLHTFLMNTLFRGGRAMELVLYECICSTESEANCCDT